MERLSLDKKTLVLYIVLVFLVLFGSVFDYINRNVFFLTKYFDYFFFLLLSTCILWLAHINRKITHRWIKKYTINCGMLILLWITIQFSKYRAAGNMELVKTYLWYFYYFPIVLLPLNALYASLYFNKNDNIIISKWWKLLYLPAFCLILLVLTNNYHQLVFKFKGDNFNDSESTHYIFYYVIVLWSTVLYIIAICNAIKALSNQAYRKYRIVPFIPFIVGFPLMVMDMFKHTSIFPYSFSEVYWFMIMAFFESMCLIKVIPTNIGYDKYFASSTINTYIYSNEKELKYSTKIKNPLDKEILFDSLNGNNIVDETKIYSYKINGGYSFFLEDLSYLYKAQRKLEEYNAMVLEYNELLESENELLAKQSRIKISNNIYDGIYQYVQEEVEYIKSIIEGLSPEDPLLIKKMRLLNIYDVFVKRISNLVLLKEKNEIVSSKDLDYSIFETFEYLEIYGIEANYRSFLKDIDLRGSLVISFYIMIYKIITTSLERINSIAVIISYSGDEVTQKVLVEGIEGYDSNVNFGDMQVTIDDNDCDVIYSLTLKGRVNYD